MQILAQTILKESFELFILHMMPLNSVIMQHLLQWVECNGYMIQWVECDGYMIQWVEYNGYMIQWVKCNGYMRHVKPEETRKLGAFPAQQ